jgi:hypothetical protein
VLLELVSDLEALVGHYRRQGMTEEEAVARAEEVLLVSPEALQHLIAVHTTGYQRWVMRAAARMRWGIDMLLFVLGVLPVLIGGLLVVGTSAGAMAASPFVWPLVACAFGIIWIAATEGWQLFVKGERSRGRLQQRLPLLIHLGVAAPVLGLLGALLGLQRLTSLVADGSGGSSTLALLEQVGRNASILAVGLLLAFGAGMVWYVLVNRIGAIERAESAALLALD